MACCGRRENKMNDDLISRKEMLEAIDEEDMKDGKTD